MAGEHEHNWISNILDSGHQICMICGADKVEWREQQLVQAQRQQSLLETEAGFLKAHLKTANESDAPARVLLDGVITQVVLDRTTTALVYLQICAILAEHKE